MTINEQFWEYMQQFNYEGAWRFLVLELSNEAVLGRYTTDTWVGACAAAVLSGNSFSDIEADLCKLENAVPDAQNSQTRYLFRKSCLHFFSNSYSHCINISNGLLKSQSVSDRMLEYLYCFQISSFARLMNPDRSVEIASNALGLFPSSPIVNLAAIELEQNYPFLECPDILIIDLVLTKHDPTIKEYYLGTFIPIKGLVLLGNLAFRDAQKTGDEKILESAKKIHGDVLSKYGNSPEMGSYLTNTLKDVMPENVRRDFLNAVPNTSQDKLLALFTISSNEATSYIDEHFTNPTNQLSPPVLYSYIKQVVINQDRNTMRGLNLIRILVEREPLFFSAWMLYGDLLVRQGNLEDGVKAFEQGLSLLNHAGDKALEPTQSVIEHGSFADAYSLLKIAISECSTTDRVQHNLVSLFSLAVILKEWEQARELFLFITATCEDWFIKYLPMIYADLKVLWYHSSKDQQIDSELFDLIGAGFILTGRHSDLHDMISQIENHSDLPENLLKELQLDKDLIKSQELINERKFEECSRLLEFLLSESWNNIIASQYISCLVHSGAIWKIPETLDRWLSDHADNKDLPLFIANYVCNTFKKSDEILTQVDSLIDKYPYLIQLYVTKAELLFEGKSYAQGAKFCGDAITLFPNDCRLRWMQGRFLAEQGEHEHAREIWREIIKTEPDNSEFISSLVSSLEQDNLDAEIIETLRYSYEAGMVESELMILFLQKLGKTGYDRRLEYKVLYYLRDTVNEVHKHLFRLRQELLKHQEGMASLQDITQFGRRLLEALGTRNFLGLCRDRDGIVVLINPIKLNQEIIKSSTINQTKDLFVNTVNILASEISSSLRPEIYIFSDLLKDIGINHLDTFQRIANAESIIDFGTLNTFRFISKHKELVKNKFEQYLMVYSIFGSFVRGESTAKSDLDAFFILDDTDLVKMTRSELADNVREISNQYAMEVFKELNIEDVKLNMQIYLLTDFWNKLRIASPTIISILKDSVPFYDVGVLRPWKNLFQRGELIPTIKATERYLSDSQEIMNKLRRKTTTDFIVELFNANLMLCRAGLMAFGIVGPHPRESAILLKEILVEDKKLISEKSAQHFSNIVSLY